MKKICFVTGTRADYGILAPVMREVAKSSDAVLQIVATNMHLSIDYGMTVNEIEADGFVVDEKIDSLVTGGTPSTVANSMARTEEGLAGAFVRLNPDLVVILGDRYEALAAASAAVVFNIPIVHLHGGEITLGAIDDKFRNAITMLSDWHFAATPQYVERIIKMGINPDKVFHSGAPGAQCSENFDGNTEEEFFEKTGLRSYQPFIILAFHPVTKFADKGVEELKSTLEALNLFINQGYKILVTMPNSDPGNKEISKALEEWSASQNESVKTVKSLGAKLFRYALDKGAVIIGNSSAALIEAPTFRLPAVNVGFRQSGRVHGITVIDTPAKKDRIVNALTAALSLEMKAVIMGMPVSALNPYFKENSAQFIAQKLLEL